MVSKMPGKTLPLSGTKHHPLFKLHYPARFDPLAEYSQPEAKNVSTPEVRYLEVSSDVVVGD